MAGRFELRCVAKRKFGPTEALAALLERQRSISQHVALRLRLGRETKRMVETDARLTICCQYDNVVP
jgi:hypothetical protein